MLDVFFVMMYLSRKVALHKPTRGFKLEAPMQGHLESSVREQVVRCLLGLFLVFKKCFPDTLAQLCLSPACRAVISVSCLVCLQRICWCFF